MLPHLERRTLATECAAFVFSSVNKRVLIREERRRRRRQYCGECWGKFVIFMCSSTYLLFAVMLRKNLYETKNCMALLTRLKRGIYQAEVRHLPHA